MFGAFRRRRREEEEQAAVADLIPIPEGTPCFTVKSGGCQYWSTAGTKYFFRDVSFSDTYRPFHCECGCLRVVWTNLVAKEGSTIGVYAKGCWR